MSTEQLSDNYPDNYDIGHCTVCGNLGFTFGGSVCADCAMKGTVITDAMTVAEKELDEAKERIDDRGWAF